MVWSLGSAWQRRHHNFDLLRAEKDISVAKELLEMDPKTPRFLRPVCLCSSVLIAGSLYYLTNDMNKGNETRKSTPHGWGCIRVWRKLK
eukprot:4827546-Amphidinium_carterae.1